MDFPYEVKHMHHRFGGLITTIHGIVHQACPARDGRSLDAWWFDCDIQWKDTGKVSRGPCEPFKLCFDPDEAGVGGQVEYDMLMKVMNDYLMEHGEWCGEGKHEGWYAHDRKNRRAA